MKFIIVDTYSKEPGYVYHSPIEGWIFEKRKDKATQFNTREEARATIDKEYPRLARYLKVVLYQSPKK